MNNNCEFCIELKDNLNYDLKFYSQLQHLRLSNRIIHETKNWVLTPTLGCYVEGYALAVHKSHLLSLSNCSQESIDEITELADILRRAYKKIYNSNMIFFEHGTIKKEYSSNSIDHAHIHFIPTNKMMWDLFVSEYQPEFYQIDCISKINNTVKKKQLSSYLLFCDVNEHIYIIAPNREKYPSQFFRKYIANQIDERIQWDWKKRLYFENMHKTYWKLLDFFN